MQSIIYNKKKLLNMLCINSEPIIRNWVNSRYQPQIEIKKYIQFTFWYLIIDVDTTRILSIIGLGGFFNYYIKFVSVF